MSSLRLLDTICRKRAFHRPDARKPAPQKSHFQYAEEELFGITAKYLVTSGSRLKVSSRKIKNLSR
jgi:hypothetical protein